MKTMESKIATTYMDRHNERMTLSALLGMVDQIGYQIIPMLWNHDPRLPPIGRLISARVEQLPDGEYALIGVTELFDPDEDIPILADGRDIPIHVPEDNIEVEYDRSYASHEDQEEIDRLVAVINGTKHESGKKALEPLSVLALVGIYALGKFADGFLQKIGEDAWDAFVASVRRLLRRKRTTTSEFVLQFQFVPGDLSFPLSVQVNITNPTDADLDLFLAEGIGYLDRLVPTLIEGRADIRSLVFEFSHGKTQYRFAIRNDAAPVILLPHK